MHKKIQTKRKKKEYAHSAANNENNALPVINDDKAHRMHRTFARTKKHVKLRT